MVVVKEGSLGSGFWAKQSKVYKDISEKNTESELIKEKVLSYILPRLYKTNLLSNVFISLRQKISSKLFDSIGYGEHHIIFQEAISMTKSFYYYKDKDLIKHYEDESMRSIYRKYKGYGKDQLILKALPGYNASRLTTHRRKLNMTQFKGNIVCLPIISLRTVSFLVGILF